MKKLALVVLGGTIGSLARYLLTETIPEYFLAILIVNLGGVAIAGLVAFWLPTSPNQQLFWIPGFAGGFTTFSSVAVIYATNDSVKAFSYFFGMAIASLLVLSLIRIKQAR